MVVDERVVKLEGSNDGDDEFGVMIRIDWSDNWNACNCDDNRDDRMTNVIMLLK